MISDISNLMKAVDAVTDQTNAKDIAALERNLDQLTPERREALAKELVESGTATFGNNGQAFRLQIKHRPLPRG